MSVEFANRGIVTDGLTYSIDAYSSKSYVSGSTTVNNLKRNGDDGTLINGVAFTDKAWDFDGTDDYIDLGQPTILESLVYTYSVWFYPLTSGAGVLNGGIYTRGQTRGNGTINKDFDIVMNGTGILFTGVQGSGFGYANNWQITGTLPTINEWHEVVVSWDGTTNADGVKMYLDGVFEVSDTALSATQATRFNHHINGKGTYVGVNKISKFSTYNKVLTPQEVTQNHNALKGRFIRYGT